MGCPGKPASARAAEVNADEVDNGPTVVAFHGEGAFPKLPSRV
jgi:hypothetical protein